MLAGLMFSQSKLERAEELERQALGTMSKLLAPAHPDVALCTQFLTQVLLKRGRPAEARRLMESCLATQSKTEDADNVALAWSRSLLGQCLLQERETAAAETLLVGSVEYLLADATFARSRKHMALKATIDALTANGKRDEASGLQARLDSLSRK
jgi:hypothetical protein